MPKGGSRLWKTGALQRGAPYAPMDRPITPIFNITKRPRQALVSDPFDSQPSLSSTSVVPAAAHKGPQQRSQSGSWNQGRTNPSMMSDLLPPKPTLSQYQSQNMLRAGSSLKATQNQSYSRAAPPTKQATVAGGTDPGRRTSSGLTNFQSRNINYPRSGNSQASSFQGFQGNNTSFNQKRQYQQSDQEKPNNMTSHSLQRGMSNMPHVNQPIHISQTSNVRSSFPPKQKFSTQAYNKSQIRGQFQNSNNTRCSSPQPSTSHSTSLTSKQNTYNNNKQDVDKSLRVLTATVVCIRQWGNSVHSVPVMFEVHGTLNATVTTNVVTQGKEFLLRDETGSLPCIFFEISASEDSSVFDLVHTQLFALFPHIFLLQDRRLPLLIRGHWYRCMGTFDRKLGMFKCVSVRGSNVAERNLAKLMLPTSEETLKKLVRDLREA